MKKTITIILTVLSLLLILDSLNFSQAIMMFLLAGVIPGTNIAITGTQTLELFAVLAGFIIGRITAYLVKSFKPLITSIAQARA